MPLAICFLNGNYLPLADARISPLDRAFLFADAVYEVIPVYANRPFRLRHHLDRLQRSLAGIDMQAPLSHEEWAGICEELIVRNGGGDLYLYIQVTRGAEFGRNHVWPAGLQPTLFAYASALVPLSGAVEGVAAITANDTRWARRDLKSTSLLANVLLKKKAAEAGAFETILLENGFLTEGASTTVHVVRDDVIFTPANGEHILPGTTRSVVEQLSQRIGMRTLAAAVSESQLRAAQEIWLAFSTRGVAPVTTLDAVPVGDGKPGPWFKRMHAAFMAHVNELDGTPAL